MNTNSLVEIGGNRENPIEYVALETGEMLLAIGIEVRGVRPHVYTLERTHLWFVGCNLDVYGLNPSEAQLVFHIDLGLPFRTFERIRVDRLLVIFDTGAMLLTDAGEQLWSFDGSDVVTEHVRQGQRLQITFLGGGTANLNIDTGKPETRETV